MDGDLGEWDDPAFAVTGLDAGGVDQIGESLTSRGNVAGEIHDDTVVERGGIGGREVDFDGVQLVFFDLL